LWRGILLGCFNGGKKAQNFLFLVGFESLPRFQYNHILEYGFFVLGEKMNIGSEISIKTNLGQNKGIISDVVDYEGIIIYSGYIDGRHGFEIIYVKNEDRYSGDVNWDRQYSKKLGYNASFIEEFSEFK